MRFGPLHFAIDLGTAHNRVTADLNPAPANSKGRALCRGKAMLDVRNDALGATNAGKVR